MAVLPVAIIRVSARPAGSSQEMLSQFPVLLEGAAIFDPGPTRKSRRRIWGSGVHRTYPARVPDVENDPLRAFGSLPRMLSVSQDISLFSDTRELPALQPPESFETTRLLLRPVALSDASDIFDGYASDVEATKFMTFSRHRSLDESDQFARRCVACWQDGSAYPWAIVARDTATFAGIIEIRIKPPKADFGYVLCKAFWGRGYATEAATAVVSWAIGQPEIFRVWATCHPDNARSARVLEKSGLRPEGWLANWEARPNIGEPAGESLVYALTRSVHG